MTGKCNSQCSSRILEAVRKLARAVLKALLGDPIIIEAKNDYTGTATPPALNTETTVVEIDPQPDDYLVEGYIDTSQMQNGDTTTITEYIALDGANLKPYRSITLQGEQQQSVLRLFTKTLHKNMKYKVTITQTSGTPRQYPYAFIQEIMGES